MEGEMADKMSPRCSGETPLLAKQMALHEAQTRRQDDDEWNVEANKELNAQQELVPSEDLQQMPAGWLAEAREALQKQQQKVQDLERQLALFAQQQMDKSTPRSQQEMMMAASTDEGQVAEVDFQGPRDKTTWNGRNDGKVERGRDVREEVASQQATWVAAEPWPQFDAQGLHFAAIEIEGLELLDREAFDARLRERARKSASDSSHVEAFTATQPTRLQLLLETVVEELNHFEVQPGDWGRVLMYHLQTDVRRDVRTQQPRLTLFGPIVRYLRKTYPVGGALQALRVAQFRATVQGSQSVTEFYQALCLYHRENPADFDERELTRQFVEHLREDLQDDIRRRYDVAPTQVTLLELYQLALGQELRKAQSGRSVAPPKQQYGSWYGHAQGRGTGGGRGQSAHVVAAAIAGMQAPPAGVTCINCGGMDHPSTSCPKRCGNCRQAGHYVMGCHKPCPHCGKKFHSHRWCVSKVGNEGGDRRSIPALVVMLARVGSRQQAYPVLLTHIICGVSRNQWSWVSTPWRPSTSCPKPLCNELGVLGDPSNPVRWPSVVLGTSCPRGS